MRVAQGASCAALAVRQHQQPLVTSCDRLELWRGQEEAVLPPSVKALRKAAMAFEATTGVGADVFHVRALPGLGCCVLFNGH